MGAATDDASNEMTRITVMDCIAVLKVAISSFEYRV